MSLVVCRSGGHERIVMTTRDIKLPGVHNVENYMAAIAAVDGLVPDQVIRTFAREFGGVEHRIELVRTYHGVRFYNDSIASSPSRTIAGLRSFKEKVILIAGGYDKHIPFDVLGPEVVEHVKLLVLCGATAGKIRAAVEQAPGYRPGHPEILDVTPFQRAVETARDRAVPGDVVTLSPACAAFDQFRNFMERGKTFKAMPGWGSHFDYAVFTSGDDSVGRTVCSMACVALNAAKVYYEEKHDKGSFIKNIISDNILISDIYMRAKELHVAAEVPRGVFVIRPVDDRSEAIPVDVVQNMFPDRQNDFVLSVGDDDVALIHQMPENSCGKDLEKVAASIEEALRVDGESVVFVGIGTLALHLRDLAKAYKEAQIAIEVGKVFDTERYVINYENLGIGRLIYQLPTTLCEMFLQEVFKKNPIDALDQETLFTIYKFFENNLNVSETSRKLFVHRNTLVYRLEKIKKLTGLDLRQFDHAIVFKVALMVKKYLTSRGIDA